MTSNLAQLNSNFDINGGAIDKDFLKSKVANFFTLGKNAKTDFTSLFGLSLGISKVSLLFIFILVTIVYQIKYKDVKWAKTGLNSPNSWREWVSSGIVSTFTIFGILVFYYTRSLGDGQSLGSKIKENWLSLIIIWLIVFSFELSRESSGLNRYLNEEEIKKGHSIYNEISGPDIKFFDKNKPEDQGDPFINAFGWTSIYFLGFVVIYLIIMMFISVGYGVSSGCTSINTINYGGKSRFALFSVELLAAFAFNFIGALLGFFIKEKTFKGGFTTSTLMGVAAIIIHVACQYSGVYSDFNNNTFKTCLSQIITTYPSGNKWATTTKE